MELKSPATNRQVAPAGQCANAELLLIFDLRIVAKQRHLYPPPSPTANPFADMHPKHLKNEL